jgi:hypothetical protein
MQYSKLNTFHQRRRFDPSKTEDLEELKFFMANNHWRNVCPFYAEHPWVDIPAMCKDRFAKHLLNQA